LTGADTFRALKGFQCLLSTLQSYSGFYSSANRTDEEKHHFIELIKCLFGVLSEALSNHQGNRRFFGRRIGWENLQEGLAATGLPTEAPDQVFGLLLSFGLDDVTLSGFTVSTKRRLAEELVGKKWNNDQERINYLQETVASQFGPKDVLLNSEIVPLVVSFQIAMPQTDDSEITTVVVLQSLHSVASASKFNLVAMHSTGILRTLLPRMWEPSVPAAERLVLRSLVGCLIQMGTNHLDDGKELIKRAMVDEDAALFLLDSLKASREPPHIQFDFSLHGYSSLEIASLGRTFPPTHTPGYTLTAWINIETFDPSIHTTLFGIFDATQRCFLLGYIERDTKKFILQTSATSPRASVRFKSIVFEPKRWYHVAIVHRRGRATTTAKSALYIDGEFVEQQKAPYPQTPPSSSTHVQAFFGIPSDICTRLGRGVVSSRWSLGTMHLFEDVLSDDMIAVFHRLGSRYHGNFQDCLGSFQTYEASAALNMRNELMHPGREEKSDIVAAIRQKASGIIAESKVVLSLSATQVLDDRDDNNINESMLVQSLSKHAANNLQAFTRSGAVAMNGGVPSINEALTSSQGVAIMTGEPVIVVPQYLDDAAWKIGGAAAVGLKMVEAAKTPAQVCRAVEILFEMIKGSWRNSEVMERENGFAILSHLIRQKETEGVVRMDLLRLILEFVGYRRDAPEESFIINPLAYRILLVDFDVWRRADIETQREYFAQFVQFASKSKYHHFNSKRLVRMRECTRAPAPLGVLVLLAY
jgi:hypothetical protein